MSMPAPQAPNRASAPQGAAAPLPPTRKQTTASLLSRGLADRQQWKTLVDEAQVIWPMISLAELASTEGNVHSLAGLVQLRQRLTRAEADLAVKAFFAAHPAEPAAATA